MRLAKLGVALGALALTACGGEEAGGGAPADDSLPPDKATAAEAVEYGKADWSLDLCERRGWYGDGECDWFCPKRDPDCDLPPLGKDPAGAPTRYPIVLAHGFDASPTNRWGFWKVDQALLDDGHDVYVAIVPPYERVAVRAAHLARVVDDALDASGADKVNLIAHSMGGLDARHLISSLGYGDRVASLTTISSPHRGTAVADAVLKVLPGFADPLVDRLAAAWGATFNELADEKTDVAGALEDLSEANAPKFAAENPDDPKVYYQSWAGVSSPFGVHDEDDWEACEGRILRHAGTTDRLHFSLLPMAVLTGKGLRDLPNDGMATVESAKWGRFRGCIPADHLDEVGQPRHDGPVSTTGFDHLRFYRNIAFELAEMGF